MAPFRRFPAAPEMIEPTVGCPKAISKILTKKAAKGLSPGAPDAESLVDLDGVTGGNSPRWGHWIFDLGSTD